MKSLKVELTSCQEQALEKLQSKDNVFLTGVAGSGKSFLVQRFIRGLDRKAFPVLASTGAAAVLIGGRTFHSFFGLGIMEGGLSYTVDRALSDRRLQHRLKRMEGFILDEVSMISGEALHAAEIITRTLRDNEEPWGGIKVVVVGDFAQLPPVTGRDQSQKDWAFLSETWEYSNFVPAVLNTIVRTDDTEFLEVLNEVRHGKVTEQVEEFLNRKTEIITEDYQGTCLFPRRYTTAQYNQKRLSEVDAELVRIPTEYMGKKNAIETLKRSAPIPEVLELKEGAYVMTRINDPKYRFINGTTGHVVGIDKNEVHIELKSGRVVEVEKIDFALLDADGQPQATARNYPLTLAYATTIHKAQGTTLDELMVDLRSLWEPGQAYVALSRMRSADGLKIRGWDPQSIRVDEAVVRFHNSLS